MNQLVVDLVKAFEEQRDSLAEPVKTSRGLFPHLRSRELTIGILRELFLRPYLTSRELSAEFGISREDLKEVYSSIRSIGEIRDLFQFSPYAYLIKTLGELAQNGERTGRIIRGETPSPLSKTMELFISTSCNAKCNFCYRDGKLYDRKAMSTGDFVKLVDQFADLGGENLDVSGGLEPLLSPSIRQVLQEGVDRKLRVTLYTNGIELGKPSLLETLLKIDRIRVSLNASDKESYRDAIGVDKFETVTRNLAEVIKQRRGTNPRIGISFLVHTENYGKIFDSIRLAQELGVDFLDLRSVHVTNTRDFNQRQRDELKSILKQIRGAVLSGEYGRLSVSIADTFNFINPEDPLLRKMRGDFADDLVKFRVTVAPHGGVYALNVVAQPGREDPDYLLGEFSEENSLLQILRNRKSIPFEPGLLLPHDVSLIVALPKLASDFEFGIGIEESPFLQP
jgi:MoaA/NifB/PqqE/SkfB family radical SAM enzyme